VSLPRQHRAESHCRPPVGYLRRSLTTSARNLKQMTKMKIEIQKYGFRHWGIYVDGELLAVTLYKKGAKAIETLLLKIGGLQ
jgi:hypothetical protein